MVVVVDGTPASLGTVALIVLGLVTDRAARLTPYRLEKLCWLDGWLATPSHR